MQHNPVGWFEIPVTDIDRAKKFYETVFGLELTRRDFMGYEMVWFPMVKDGFGITGALMKGPGYDVGSKGPVIYFTAPDMDETITRAKEAGVEVVLPKKEIGEYGYVAWIYDSEGNIIGLHRMK